MLCSRPATRSAPSIRSPIGPEAAAAACRQVLSSNWRRIVVCRHFSPSPRSRRSSVDCASWPPTSWWSPLMDSFCRFRLLEVPRLGCINVHASLLPRWRGAAPIQHTLLAGESETGITLMQMDAGLDTGPVLAQARCPVLPEDTAGTLHDRLARLGAETLLTALPKLADGTHTAIPQDRERATYAPKIDQIPSPLRLEAARPRTWSGRCGPSTPGR